MQIYSPLFNHPCSLSIDGTVIVATTLGHLFIGSSLIALP